MHLLISSSTTSKIQVASYIKSPGSLTLVARPSLVRWMSWREQVCCARPARAWSLKPNAVGATMNTSLVDCRTPLAAARVLLWPVAAATATSGTCDTRMPSRARNLRNEF